MKFLVVCMFALISTSIVGATKRDKRGLLHDAHSFSHHDIAHGLPTGHGHVTPLTATHAIHGVSLTQAAPLAQVSGFVHAPVLDQLNAAHLIHPAPAIPIAAGPAIGHHALFEKLPASQPYSGVAQQQQVHIAPLVSTQYHNGPVFALHATPAIATTHASHRHFVVPMLDLQHQYHGAATVHHF